MKHKFYLPAAIVALLLTLSAGAQHMYFNLVDAGLNLDTATNRTVIVSGNSLPRGVGSGVVIQDKFRKTTDTAGGFWISNLVQGVYLCQVLPAAGSNVKTEFRVLMTNTVGHAYARSNIVAHPDNTYPPDSVAWGAATSDARYWQRSETPGGGSATNIGITGAQLAVPATNGSGVVTITVATNAVQGVVRAMNILSNSHAAAVSFGNSLAVASFVKTPFLLDADDNYSVDAFNRVLWGGDGTVENVTWLGAGGVLFGGPMMGNGVGLTNGSPNLATNAATASDGQALVKRGDHLKLETISGSGQTNIYSTNVLDFALGVSTAMLTNVSATANRANISLGDASSTLMSWQFVKKLFATTNTYDSGGLRVATASADPDGMFRIYYAGYTNAILSGGGVNAGGQICGAFGRSIETLAKVGPVLTRSAAPAWDSGNLGGARTYRFDDSGTNYLYYFASSNTTFETGWQSMGVAYSTNGTNWVKYSGNPLLDIGTSGTWEDKALQGAQCVVQHNGVYYMFYGGMQTGSSIYGGASDENIGLAFSTSPLGPWTKYSGNPVLTNSANILAEPNVFPLPGGGGWGMILGQGYAQSRDLTNWTMVGPLTVSDPYFGSGVPIYGGVLSPFLFYDNGWAALFDDTTAVYLARPLSGPALGKFDNLTVTGTTTLADLNVTQRAIVQNLAQPTNTWAINTAIGMGTNAYYTGGAQTLGVTGVADNPTNAIYFGELELKPTGDIIFTNPVSFRASDYAITRTFTNGNSVLVAVRVKPGVSTNLTFVQFR